MVKIGQVEVGPYPLLLAPMEDVSDPPFRVLCKENGADVVYTEFISSDGLIRLADKSVDKLDVYDEERPVGIQIFGNDIEFELARPVQNAKRELSRERSSLQGPGAFGEREKRRPCIPNTHCELAIGFVPAIDPGCPLGM